jgi:predicted protein tyrosine phosphatase
MFTLPALRSTATFTKGSDGAYFVSVRCALGGASHVWSVPDAIACHANGQLTAPDGCAQAVPMAELERRLSAAEQFVVDTAPDELAHVVVPQRLFVGSQDAAVNHATLAANGIAQILNVGPAVAAPSVDDGIARLHWPLLDVAETTLPVGEAFAPLRAFIDAAPTLCHCNAGVSRSVSIAILFLLETRRCATVNEALAQIRATRPCAQPNDGFMRQLRAREKQLAAV